MGIIRDTPPVLLIIAAFAAREEAIDWGRLQAEASFGPIALESETFRFDRFTDYYESSMGAALLKKFWAFRDLIDPARLAEIKRLTNRWEEECPFTDPGIERCLNLDPGYIDLGKLILASTKDHAHRIYLRDGIFAETTLMYTQKKWKALPWSYPDYQSEGYQAFFDRCRDYLRQARQVASKHT